MFEYAHRRLNSLIGEWVLLSPHRAKRAWLGQIEKTSSENFSPFDPNCYLCPTNERTGGIKNPGHKKTFVFDNDFAALLPEIARTNRVQLDLQSGDIQGFGQLMNECHISILGLYEVSIRELDVLVEVAQNLKGCYGARLTEADFGGCMVNLVKRDHADEFVRTLGKAYQDNCGYKAEIYICKASDGAKLL